MSDRTLALVHNEDMGDWYCIEWAHHDGRSGLRAEEAGCYSFWHSGRVSDADVEGYAEHMRGIAKAIRERGFYSAKRCCVEVHDDGRVELHSPRNSTGGSEFVSYEVALALADEIDARLGLEVSDE